MPSGTHDASEASLMVQQAWLVAVREYMERVRTRSFLLVTLLTPLFLGGVLGGSVLLAMHASENQRIAIVSDDRALATAVSHELADDEHGVKQTEVVSPAGAGVEVALNRRIESKELNGYLLLHSGTGSAVPEATFVSGSSADISTSSLLASALGRATTHEAMLRRGIPEAEATRLLQKVEVETKQLNHGSAVTSDSKRSFSGAYVLVMLMYIVVLLYGMNVARSVVQEKSSRIYEVLLSAARADSLMLGKLVGVGAVGLTQVTIWFVLLALITGTSLATTYGLHGLGSLGLRPEQIVYFVIYFVLGYLFYSSISAAIGAFVGAEQELQQFSFIIVAPLMVSVLLMNSVLADPGSVMAVTMSMIPPFAPIVMYLRICAQQPPLWQILVSIGLLLVSILLITWVAARIYRIGILMYGKRATLPELLHWVRSS